MAVDDEFFSERLPLPRIRTAVQASSSTKPFANRDLPLYNFRLLFSPARTAGRKLHFRTGGQGVLEGLGSELQLYS